MTSFDAFRVAHILAGTVALTSFWIPMVAPKGGPTHRRAGWTYAIAMWLAAAMALVLCGLKLSDDVVLNDTRAIFLAFVGLLAANGAGTGVRVLRTKARRAAHRGVFDLGFSAVLLASSLGLAMYGLRRGSTLSVSFSVLGLFLSIGQLRFWLRPPASMEWWFVHMGNMLAACIGTVTAFLVVNVPKFGPGDFALLFFWLGPGVLGGLGSALWQRAYRRKFASTPAQMPSISQS